MNFDRNLLPPPRSFFEGELGASLPRADRRGWVRTNCPFHESKSKKSFSVNVEHGGFYCHGCQAKGGDAIAFLMKRDHLNFRAACERLGAWKNLDGNDRQRIAREQADREEMRARMAKLSAEAKQERIAARDLLHTLERQQDQTSKKLVEMERATPGIESPAKDELLTALCLLVEQIRVAERHYYRLAGLEERVL